MNNMKKFGRLILDIIFIMIFATFAIISVLSITFDGQISLLDVLRDLRDSNVVATSIIGLITLIFSIIGLLSSLISAIFFFRKPEKMSWIIVDFILVLVVLGLGIYLAYDYFGGIFPNISKIKSTIFTLQNIHVK